MSDDTNGSSEYSNIPCIYVCEAFFIALFMPSMVVSFFNKQTKSVIEPHGTGTLKDIPSIFPFSFGITSPTDAAAPVVVGMILMPAALALLKSLCGRSSKRWSFV